MLSPPALPLCFAMSQIYIYIYTIIPVPKVIHKSRPHSPFLKSLSVKSCLSGYCFPDFLQFDIDEGCQCHRVMITPDLCTSLGPHIQEGASPHTSDQSGSVSSIRRVPGQLVDVTVRLKGPSHHHVVHGAVLY